MVERKSKGMQPQNEETKHQIPMGNQLSDVC